MSETANITCVGAYQFGPGMDRRVPTPKKKVSVLEKNPDQIVIFGPDGSDPRATT